MMKSTLRLVHCRVRVVLAAATLSVLCLVLLQAPGRAATADGVLRGPVGAGIDCQGNIFGGTTDDHGTVSATSDAGSATVHVNLRGGTPNKTYSIELFEAADSCEYDNNANTGSTLTTDANGNGSATASVGLPFMGLGDSQGSEDAVVVLDNTLSTGVGDEFVGVTSLSTSPPPPPACTISGDASANTLSGTSGDDVICGGRGGDTIKGLGGNDILRGEAGADKLYGGEGDDTLDGGTGNDLGNYSESLTAVSVSLDTNIATGEGSDTLASIENLMGSSKNDTLIGSSANNIMKGGAGSDTINGLDGADTLTGAGGIDTMHGGLGNDTVVGSGGADNLFGDEDDDTVNSKDGVSGNDSLDGGPHVNGDTAITDPTEKSIVEFP